jgi:prophage antirepressor-like protein
MQSNIINFDYNNNQVRTATKDNEALFCLIDVAKCLNITNQNNVVSRLDTKGIHLMDTPTDGGNQKLNFISEPNLYRVIFRSDKPEAVKFQDWVFNEVLPTLRKTGSYSLKNHPPIETKQEEDKEINQIPPRDKDNFYYLNIYFLKIRYIIEDNAPLFLLNDIDNFLGVTKLDGINQERNKNNYTIHHILYDYNIVPRGKYIDNSLYLFLNLTQLIEFCYNFKTKRAELLENILTNRIIKYIEENHRTEIETKSKNIFLITA